MDQWDGYPAERQRLLQMIRQGRIQDVVFLTGDIHSFWACEVPFRASDYPITRESVAVEFVGTSVTAENVNDLIGREEDNPLSRLAESLFKDFNPYIKDIDLDAHGYTVVDVSAERIQADWYFISDRTDPLASARFATAWRSDTGTSRLESVSEPLSTRHLQPG